MNRALLKLATGALATVALVVTVRAELPAPVKSLVDVERAFAAAGAAKGQKDAYLEFLADDSLLFRPGPVPGKMFYRTRPLPPGALSWAPVFADVSSAADYGLSVGPYEYRKEGGKPGDAPAAYGDFVTIWRKQKDGTWKIEVDLSVSHDKSSSAKPVAELTDADVVAFKAAPAPATASAGAAGAKKAGADAAKPAAPKPGAAAAPPAAAPSAAAGSTPPASPPTSPSAATPGAMTPKPADPAVQALTDVEKAFAKAAAADGLVKAYRAVALDELRILRNGALPIVGKKDLEKAFGAAPAAVGSNGASSAPSAPTWEPVHTRVATSGDFGYTTGTIATASAPNPMGGGAPGQRQYYVHVWRRDAAGTWKLLLDIVV